MANCVPGTVLSEDGSFLTIVPSDAKSQSEINCDLCEQDSDFRRAVGFCIECQNYLCDKCFRYHCRPLPMQHHSLLDKNEMPKKKVSGSLPEVCQKHEGETIKFYCKSHEAFGCNSCMVIEHKPCPEISSLAEIAKGVETSEKYRNLCDKMTATKEELEDLIKVAHKNIEVSKTCREEAVTRVDEFQDKMMRKLQKLRNEIIKEAKEKEKKDLIKIKQLEAKAYESREDLRGLETDMKILEETKQSKQLFIAMKKMEKQHEDIKRKLENVKKKNKVERYSFVENDLFSSMMQNTDALGELYIHKADNSLEEIHSSYSNYFEYAIPKCMKVQDKQVIMTDSIYNKVYMVAEMEIVAEKTLTSLPWDITQMEENQFAVTLPNERKIKILSVADKEIKECTEIQVDARCEGIAFSENTLFVACTDPPSVIVVDTSGKIIQTISSDESGCPLFRQPAYIDFNKEKQLICVTDRQSASVTLMTRKGKVHKVYKLDKVKVPASVISKEGSVAVGDSKGSNVCKIQIDTGECEYNSEISDGIDECLMFFKFDMKPSKMGTVAAGYFVFNSEDE